MAAREVRVVRVDSRHAAYLARLGEEISPESRETV
jgi:hypothetical protein